MRIKVIAKSGAKCPMENRPHQYIDAKTPVEVENTTYYRRLIMDGSLVLVQQSSSAVAQQSDKGLQPLEKEKQQKSKKRRYE